MAENLKNIIGELVVLYREQGIQAISIDELTRKMNIPEDTFYKHVYNNEELISKVIDYDLHLRQAEIDKIAQSKQNALEQFISIQELFLSFMQEFISVIETDLRKNYPHMYQSAYKKYIRMFENIIVINIQKGKEEDIYKREIKEQYHARSYISRIVQIRQNKMLQPEEISYKQYVPEFSDFYLKDLANEHGETLFKNFIKNPEHIN